METTHTAATPLLDFDDKSIRDLIDGRGWRRLPPLERVGAIYDFVRDEVPFGYNHSDDLPASRVLADGYGQCNTKTTLLMALLRGVGIPCRFHGATIDKRLQKGVVRGVAYLLAPRRILHSWAEVFVNGRWVALEGVILDREYLDGVRSTFPDRRDAFLGFGVGTESLSNPPIEWRGTDTYIQKTGVDQDFGVFDDPDRFYAEHGTNLSRFKRWIFDQWVRDSMNARVAGIRTHP